MALETGNYISNLVAANPPANDPKSQGDDHIRLIKAAAINSFPGFTGTIMAGGTDVGVSNVYVLNPPSGLLAYTANMMVLWFPSNTNGGASTINISGLGPISIKRMDGSAIVNGDIMANQPLAMVFNGAEFRLIAVTKQYVDNLVISGVLPGQAGNAGKPLITDGIAATFRNDFGIAMDEAKGVDIVSASTINLSGIAGSGNLVHITGSNTINLMTLASGAERTLVFDGVPVLTNSGNLILPTGANITAAVGDTVIVRGDGSGIARIISYTRASGRPLVEQTPTALTLVATLTPTAVAAIDFLNTFNATYDDYVVICEGISNNTAGVTGDVLLLRVAIAGVIDTSGNYFAAPANTAVGASATQYATQARVNSTNKLNIKIEFYGVNQADQHGIFFDSSTPFLANGGQPNSISLRGGHNGLAISGFRLYWSGGSNFAVTGTIKIYGIKRV